MESFLQLLLKAAPWVLLWCAVDDRMRRIEHNVSVLDRELVITKTALIRHSGDQLHLTPHPSPN